MSVEPLGCCEPGGEAGPDVGGRDPGKGPALYGGSLGVPAGGLAPSGLPYRETKPDSVLFMDSGDMGPLVRFMVGEGGAGRKRRRDQARMFMRLRRAGLCCRVETGGGGRQSQGVVVVGVGRVLSRSAFSSMRCRRAQKC